MISKLDPEDDYLRRRTRAIVVKHQNCKLVAIATEYPTACTARVLYY